jgi:zinc protease
MRMGDEDRFAMRILSTLLGGQSGRLFIELREKKSLAYTVAPITMEGLERGYVGTYIACAPQKREEALAGIKSVLTKLAEKGPTPSEMRRARQYYLGHRAMDQQGDSSMATHLGLELLYGTPYLDEAGVTKRINAVAPADVQAVCRKFLVEPHMVTSVVG